MEKTLAIFKPDAVARQLAGDILKRIEASGLRIVGLRLTQLTRADAESFYAVHKGRPFYKSLCDYMTSGPVIVAVLEGEGAIKRWRDLMGATDPAKAAAGTIRKDFGQNVEQNATHGSDAPETAANEIAFFFRGLELIY
ncbi:MAG: nucleoside-diphosphate kinase [Candidatus Binataceae bacterium]|jgi:nucleoside-diphosphate kinase|nr:nucleoside-diphosphate kinase [Candidatus Binataceae bacterium]